MKNLFICVHLLVISFSVFAQTSNQTYNLRFAPQKDKNYSIIMKSSMSFGASSMGSEEKESKNDMIIYMSAIPRSVDANGQVKIDSKISKIAAIVIKDGKTFNYSSEKPNTNPELNKFDEGIRKIVAKPFVMLFSAQGKFISVDGLPEGTEFIRNFRFATVLPAKPVKIGDSWTENIEDTTNGMTIKSIITYKLENIKNGELYISYLGDMELMNINSAKAMKGLSILDKETGWTKNSNGIVNMELDLTFMKIAVKSDINYESK